MQTRLSLILTVLLLQAGVVCFAANETAEKPLVAHTFEAFKQDSARIRKQMQPGGVYEHTSANEQERVEAQLGAMYKLLEAHSAQAEMSESDKVAMLNAQEEINGILQHNDNNRLVCEHVAPVGSHRPVTTCQTYGQLMARQQADQKSLQDRLRTPQLAQPQQGK
jgi:hypothetical protein